MPQFLFVCTFKCMTDTGALLWLQCWPWEEKGTKSSSSPITVYRRSTSTVNDTGCLGFFEIKLTDIDGDNLTSTATINTSSLLNISTTTTTTITLVCDDTAGDARSDVNASLIIMNGTHLALIDKSHVAIDVFIFVNVCTQHLLKVVDLSACNSCCLFVHTCFVKFATILHFMLDKQVWILVAYLIQQFI